MRWISSKAVKNFEDPSVIAVSVVDYRSFTEIINKYQFKLNTGTGSRGLLDAIDKIKEGSQWEYDPSRCYFAEYYNANGLTSDYSRNDPETTANIIRVNYMRGMYYPLIQSGLNTLTATCLDQKIYFKMFVPARYIVEFNGKPANRFQVS